MIVKVESLRKPGKSVKTEFKKPAVPSCVRVHPYQRMPSAKMDSGSKRSTGAGSGLPSYNIGSPKLPQTAASDLPSSSKEPTCQGTPQNGTKGTIKVEIGKDGRKRTTISFNGTEAMLHNPVNFSSWFQRIESFVVNFSFLSVARVQ